jgi:hypothetical protein
LFANTVLAQLKVGLTGGMVLSSLVRDSQLVANDGVVGFLIGANAKLSLGDLGWFIRSGINYTQEGDYEQSISFLKVPLTLGLDAFNDVSIFVTHHLAWLVGNENSVQDFYHDFANILGLGFEIHISTKFSVGSSLNYGLSNLVSEPDPNKNFKVKPISLDLYVTYHLN